MLWLPKRTQLWACFNTKPNRLYRRLRLFPSKLQEHTPPPFSRLSTQYHIDTLLTCFLSLDTSRTSLRLQQSTKFGNRHTAHGRYEYSYNLATSRENWAQKKIADRTAGRSELGSARAREQSVHAHSMDRKSNFSFEKFYVRWYVKVAGYGNGRGQRSKRHNSQCSR